MVRKKQSSNFKGVWGSAPPGWRRCKPCVWPFKFHDKYLSNNLVINLASCRCTISPLACNSLWVCPIKHSTPTLKEHITLRHVHSHVSFPLWSSHWCIVFFLSSPAVKCEPKPHSTSLFHPSSPALSPSWPCVFRTSAAFAFPTL